jgi:nucleotide-binding universal stress UspA family protein
MHKILVPVDYSDDAANAAIYALEIALKTKSEVIILHSYHVPVVATEAPVQTYEILIENVQKDEDEKMEKFLSNLLKSGNGKYQSIEVKTKVQLGFAIEAICETAEIENANLIVMGTRGASGIKKALMGSNTNDVIKKGKIPVLAIPSGASFKGLDRIVFACDYRLTENEDRLYVLTELALVFDAEILIFNVVDDREKLPSFDHALQGLKIENVLRGAEHSYHFADKDTRDVSEIIDEFILSQKADLLVTIPKKMDFLGSLFHKSLTKEMACHSKTPLLALPE